jgi:hypothetical protein
MRESLALSEQDWQSFLWHARNGFSDFRQWHSAAGEYALDDLPLELTEVPPDWLEDPEAIGCVVLRVIREGNARLAAPIARYFFQVYQPNPELPLLPPGIGLAWLALARAGLEPAIPPARLADLALHDPKFFFMGVEESDLPELSRLILQARPSIEAYDLHSLIAAVDRAQIHTRAPFRAFDSLLKHDWIPTKSKLEFCRGLLGCPHETELLRKWREGLRASFIADPDVLCLIPRCWGDVMDSGVGWRIPGLKRHAVTALVEELGEPLEPVIKEFLLLPCADQESENAVSMGVIDLIARNADALGETKVKSLLGKARKQGLAAVRQAAYRVGAERFGLQYARPALKDQAGMVRNWAAKALQSKTVRPARGYRSKDRSISSTDS